MNIPFTKIIHLLHSSPHGALATHSRAQPGYPFATVLPFVPDAKHRPIFLISSLAEHTRNVRNNPCASFLVYEPDADDVQTSARLTIVGNMMPLEPDPELLTRYLRYRPDAEQLLQLGDFSFFRLESRQLRYIGEFGQMGWVNAEATPEALCLDPSTENNLLSQTLPLLPPNTRLLGIDPLGADLAVNRQRRRYPWPQAPVPAEALAAAMTVLRPGPPQQDH